MLNEINDILQQNFSNLRTNKQSKYRRGIKRTRENALKKQYDEGPDLL